MLGRVRNETGQMAVELAALVPVVIVVSLIVFNLCRFCMLCATFDRTSMDAVVALGTTCGGSGNNIVSVQEVEQAIGRSLGNSRACEVRVAVESASPQAFGSLGLAPSHVRYRCELVYRPWPTALTVAGVSMGTPIALTHERCLVVDRYKSGVVM